MPARRQQVAVHLAPCGRAVPSKEEMKQVFLAAGEDRRALFFALGATLACCSGRPKWDTLLRKRGFRRIVKDASSSSGLPKLRLKGTEGDFVNWHGVGIMVMDVQRKAVPLYKDGAELGDALAQSCYGWCAFDERSWERYFWLGRAAAKGYERDHNDIAGAAFVELKLFDDGKGLGRVVFEIGAACKGHLVDDTAFGSEMPPEFLTAMTRAVALHDEWCEDAKRAVWCWIWSSKQLGVGKDVRLLIVRALWAQRVTWIPKARE